MDLSKLPKLSDTKRRIQEQPFEEPVEIFPSQVIALPPRMKLGAGIWFNLIVGVLFMMVARDFGQYVVSRLTHQPFHTNVFWPDDSLHNGKEVEYFDLMGFTALSDMGIFLFGAFVVFEVFVNAVAALIPRSVVILFCFLLDGWIAFGVLFLNVYVCYKLSGIHVIPTLSGLVLLLGLWNLFIQRRVFKSYQGTWA